MKRRREAVAGEVAIAVNAAVDPTANLVSTKMVGRAPNGDGLSRSGTTRRGRGSWIRR
jgi:hypothetical protein